MQFHHIGIATNDIESLIKKLTKQLDIKKVSEIIYDKNQEANLCMITTSDGIKIELISGKVVQNLVKKKQFLYHTCYVVKNIEQKIKELVADGALLVREPREAILFNNQKVAFLMWDLGLMEILEMGGVLNYDFNIINIFTILRYNITNLLFSAKKMSMVCFTII